MMISDIRRKIHGLLYKACDEYLEEEDFREYWYDILRLGIGVIRYKNGVIRFEIWIERFSLHLMI